jgi:hypothetical protein
MRVAGTRLQPAVARLLAEVLAREGQPSTSARITDAIERGVTTEAPLTPGDYDAILEALERECPSTLYGLRRRLVEDERRFRYRTRS